MKKILVVGATGTIGSAVVRKLMGQVNLARLGVEQLSSAQIVPV